METEQVKRIVEAAIFAAGQPLSLVQLHALFLESDLVGSEAVGQALEELRADYTGRGVELVEVASGFRFQVHGDVHPFVARLWTERQTRYSRALLETLSLVAYRQPITRAEIEQIRGVAVSTNIVRTLEEREWIRVVGHRDVPGKPALFGTTRQFLDYFNLKSLDQLPPLAEIRDIEDLEPQLELPEPGGFDATLEGDGDSDDAPARMAATESANEPIAASAALADDEPTDHDPEGDEPADAARRLDADAHDSAVKNDPENRT